MFYSVILGGILNPTSLLKNPILYISVQKRLYITIYTYIYKVKIDKIKKAYVDSRYKTNGSASNSDFKCGLKEVLYLLVNTVCCIGDISTPHTWYTIEENLNNTLYIITTKMNTGIPTWYHSLALEIPTGNYTGSSLALALQTELQFAEPDHQFVCIYNAARGNITILSETISLFNILT